MAAKAYVLLKTAPGLTKSVYSSLRIAPGVQSVEMITGPYDLIVALEGTTTTAILTKIMNDIRPAAGIRDTMTCLVVPGEGSESKED